MPRRLVKRVLVTGASGFIGRHLISALVEDNIDVLALGRTPSKVPAAGVEMRIGDVTDEAAIRGLMKGCDTVFHLAGVAHRIGESLTDADFDRVNVEGTRNVLNEARRTGVERFLFLSSVLVGGNTSSRPLTEVDEPKPADAYSRSKLRAEKLVQKSTGDGGISSFILRPPMVYGPGNRGNLPRLASLIRRGIPLPFGSIANARSVIFVRNLVQAIILLVKGETPSGEIFYVADDSPLSTADLARRIGDAIGTPARIISVPRELLGSFARAGDMLARIGPFPFTSIELTKLTASLVVDDTKIRRLTGYAPMTTTDQGISETFATADAQHARAWR